MKKIEMVRNVVDFLRSEHEVLSPSLNPVKYSPGVLAKKTGGYAPTIGRYSAEIVKELLSFGINCGYKRDKNIYFELWK
jgi:hypothetical protein